MKKKTLSLVFICLSGASALIYEIVWQRYLAILLGAHARASSIVLAVFLGGMSVGYALFGKFSRKREVNLIHSFCLIELLLALWALCFPFFFHLAFKSTGWLYQTWGLNNLSIDLFVSSALIGFPTVLMGGTLPLLTQALSKNVEEASSLHSKLYGFNTLGACFGCFFAGYILIPETSFEKALCFGAALNLSTALFFYFGKVGSKKRVVEGLKEQKVPLNKIQRILVGIGFLSGLSVLTLETVLIRLMGLSTGASSYNFTLIVAIFIFALAIGSLAAKKIAKATPKHLLWSQLLCAGSLLLLYISGDYWSYIAHVLRASLKDVPQAFYLFQILLAVVFAGLLIVPIGLCGLTLPLCFHLLKDEESTLGYRVGQLYCWNTVGCVFGALVGGYLLLNYLNLDQIFRIVILLILLSSLCALWIFLRTSEASRKAGWMGFAPVILFLTVIFLPGYHAERWIQSFRNQDQIDATLKGARAFGTHLSRTTKIDYWKDGPNTSLGVGITPKEGNEESRSIFINGKSDGNTRGDFFTTVMLAHIPALLTEKVGKSCVIGFGTGITIGTLGLYSESEQIDVLEISDTVIKNAFRFDAYNGGVSKNPKVHFHELDAFRFFEAGKDRYDIIISEPSNPWVMGIENLYSREFYQLARKQLSENGTFAQWIHTYSFNDDLFRMVLKTMHSEFPYISVFQLKGGDFALIGRTKPFGPGIFASLLQKMEESAVKTTLQTAGITLPEVLFSLEVIPPGSMGFITEGAEMHTLTAPRLSNESAKAFFMRSSASPLIYRRVSKNWPKVVKDSLLRQYLAKKPLTQTALAALRFTFCDNLASKNTALCEESVFASHLEDSQFIKSGKYGEVLASRVVASIDRSRLLKRDVFKPENLSEVYNFFESYKKYISPIVFTEPSLFIGRLDECLKTSSRTNELYGECLLQKLLVIDGLAITELDFDSLSENYLTWFKTIPTTHPQYRKLKEAGDILIRMRKKI